tara:strand:- start:395 stop:595 length:201 start_codon:yes stop_codon:yes gene_type:complete
MRKNTKGGYSRRKYLLSEKQIMQIVYDMMYADGYDIDDVDLELHHKHTAEVWRRIKGEYKKDLCEE